MHRGWKGQSLLPPSLRGYDSIHVRGKFEGTRGNPKFESDKSRLEHSVEMSGNLVGDATSTQALGRITRNGEE